MKFFHPSVRLTNEKSRAFVSIRLTNQIALFPFVCCFCFVRAFSFQGPMKITLWMSLYLVCLGRCDCIVKSFKSNFFFFLAKPRIQLKCMQSYRVFGISFNPVPFFLDFPGLSWEGRGLGRLLYSRRYIVWCFVPFNKF